MSCIVYITNKRTNTRYAYRSESYRDPITKKPKSRRTYLGRVDPITNEIIPKAPKGKRNRSPIGVKASEAKEKPFTSSPDPQSISELIRQVDFLKKEQDELRKKVADMELLITTIHKLVHDIGSSTYS